MTKTCTECQYQVLEKEDKAEPIEEAPEDCPKCGGAGTVVRGEEAEQDDQE